MKVRKTRPSRMLGTSARQRPAGTKSTSDNSTAAKVKNVSRSAVIDCPPNEVHSNVQVGRAREKLVRASEVGLGHAVRTPAALTSPVLLLDKLPLRLYDRKVIFPYYSVDEHDRFYGRRRLA